MMEPWLTFSTAANHDMTSAVVFSVKVIGCLKAIVTEIVHTTVVTDDGSGEMAWVGDRLDVGMAWVGD